MRDLNYVKSWKELKKLGNIYALEKTLLESKDHFRSRISSSRKIMLTNLKNRGVKVQI